MTRLKTAPSENSHTKKLAPFENGPPENASEAVRKRPGNGQETARKWPGSDTENGTAVRGQKRQETEYSRKTDRPKRLEETKTVESRQNVQKEAENDTSLILFLC